MKPVRKIASVCLVSLAAIGSALPAAAGDWQAWDGQNDASPLAVYATDTNQHGVLLTCGANGKVAAMISMSPGDMPDLLSKNAPYGRSADAVVSVGDGEEVETSLRYIPAIDTVETRAPSIAAKVFNAAVLGERLNISVKREGAIESMLPPPNKTFKAFATTCKKLREKSNT